MIIERRNNDAQYEPIYFHMKVIVILRVRDVLERAPSMTILPNNVLLFTL